MPEVYASLHNNVVQGAKTLIRRERLVYLILSGGVIIFFLLVNRLPVASHPVVQSVVPLYLILLIFSYLVRGIADFNAMTLNALHLENQVFLAHVIAVGVSLVLALVLTAKLGLIGLIAAVFVAATIYLVVTQAFASRALRRVVASAC